jgi:hypothetical protein
VYDIYGAQGLDAGLTVGTKLQSVEEMRAAWAAFQAKAADARLEAKVAHRGAYVVKIDACDAVDPYDASAARAPELAGMAMSTQVHLPLGDRAGATLGGQVGVRRGAGGGAFVAGVRRVLDAATSVDASATLGLRALLTLASHRQLGERTSSSVSFTWQPAAPRAAAPAVAGLTLTSARRLTETVDADASWTVGPASAAGAALGFVRRGASLTVAARVEVGAATGLSGRFVWRLHSGVAARLVWRVGTAGAEVEVGATKRLSDVATAGAGLAVGSGGVTLRPRFARGGHAFDFPILLSRGAPGTRDAADAKALAIALLGPPLAGLALQAVVLRPVRRALRARADAARRAAAAGETAAVLARARDQARLLAPVARRRAAKEAAAGGIIVVAALYGPPAALDRAAARGEEEKESGGEADADADASSPTSPTSPDPLAELATLAAAVDVTAALRLLVGGGRLTLAATAPRPALLGFCDPAPGEAKALHIAYVHRGVACVARVADGAPVDLPAATPAPARGRAAAAALAEAEALCPGSGTPKAVAEAAQTPAQAQKKRLFGR